MSLESAVEEIFRSPPSVLNWCAMCRAAVALVDRLTFRHDGNLASNRAFRQAVGYLMCSPKPLTREDSLSHEALERRMNFEESERKQMLTAFGEFDRSLKTWAVEMDGDEESSIYVDERVPLAVFLVGLKDECNGTDRSGLLFKKTLGISTFRRIYFRNLAHNLQDGAIAPEPPSEPPNESPSESPQTNLNEKMCEFFDRSLKAQDGIHDCAKILASDALTDGVTHRRAGTLAEIRQEDEVRRRYAANGRRGLRGLVAQVLREAAWQLHDGHANTPKGRDACYNRVYAQLNPRHRTTRAAGTVPRNCVDSHF